MADDDLAEAKDPVEAETGGSGSEDSSTEGAGGAKRGRSAKEPPPPKIWRIEGVSPEGVKVTLGRYATKEEAEPELDRLGQDDFYEKLRLVKSPLPE